MKMKNVISEALVPKGYNLDMKDFENLLKEKLAIVKKGISGSSQYLIVSVSINGEKPFNISGNLLRLAFFLKDRSENNEITNFDVLAVTNYRNFARSIADEI